MTHPILVTTQSMWQVTTYSDGHSEVELFTKERTWQQWAWLSWDMSAAPLPIPQVAKNLVYHSRDSLRHCFCLHRSYTLSTWFARRQGKVLRINRKRGS